MENAQPFEVTISFKGVVLAESSIAAEIVKSVIIKLLVQIDRRANLSIHHILLQIRQALRLEAMVIKMSIFY